MDKTTMDKKKTKLQNWSEQELARQESGLTVTQWCRRENMNPNTYYSHLCKIRENLSEQISVPVTTLTENTQTEVAAIRIEWGELKVEISANVPCDKIAAIIGALKC